MKNSLLITSLFLGLIALTTMGCPQNKEAQEEAKRKTDSARMHDSLIASITLERLLDLPNEAALKAQYGESCVIFDTIWGAEGFFSMGTILRTEPQSHIEITWMNEETKNGIVSVTQVSDSDWYGDTLESSRWRSSSGVSIGMSWEELQKINGRPYTLAGFGWDYAGNIHDWQKGNLEGKGIAVQLSEAPASLTWTPEQSAQILGDVDVQSDNPLLKELRPRVWSISVAKVQ